MSAGGGAAGGAAAADDPNFVLFQQIRGSIAAQYQQEIATLKAANEALEEEKQNWKKTNDSIMTRYSSANRRAQLAEDQLARADTQITKLNLKHNEKDETIQELNEKVKQQINSSKPLHDTIKIKIFFKNIFKKKKK